VSLTPLRNGIVRPIDWVIIHVSTQKEETVAGYRTWISIGSGKHGDWLVSIDKPVDGEESLFFVQLEHPGRDIYFHVTSLSVINRLVEFLNAMNWTDSMFEVEVGSSSRLRFFCEENQLCIVRNSPGISGQEDTVRIYGTDEDKISLPKALQKALDDI
jgi:hypothetical protein